MSMLTVFDCVGHQERMKTEVTRGFGKRMGCEEIYEGGKIKYIGEI